MINDEYLEMRDASLVENLTDEDGNVCADVQLDVEGLYNAIKVATRVLDDFNSLDISNFSGSLIQGSNKILTNLKQTCDEDVSKFETLNSDNNVTLDEILKKLKGNSEQSVNDEYQIGLSNIVAAMNNMRHLLCVKDRSCESQFESLEKNDNFYEYFEDYYVDQNIDQIGYENDLNDLIEIRRKPRNEWTEDDKVRYEAIVNYYFIDVKYLKDLFAKDSSQWTDEDFEKYNEYNKSNPEEIAILQKFNYLEQTPRCYWTDDDFASYYSCISYNPELLLAYIKPMYDVLMTHHDKVVNHDEWDEDEKCIVNSYLCLADKCFGVDYADIWATDPINELYKTVFFAAFASELKFDESGNWIDDNNNNIMDALNDESNEALNKKNDSVLNAVVTILGYEPEYITQEMIVQILDDYDKRCGNYFYNLENVISEFVDYGEFDDRSFGEIFTDWGKNFIQSGCVIALNVIEGCLSLADELFQLGDFVYGVVTLAGEVGAICGVDDTWAKNFLSKDFKENLEDGYDEVVSFLGLDPEIAYGDLHKIADYGSMDALATLALSIVEGGCLVVENLVDGVVIVAGEVGAICGVDDTWAASFVNESYVEDGYDYVVSVLKIDPKIAHGDLNDFGKYVGKAATTVAVCVFTPAGMSSSLSTTAIASFNGLRALGSVTESELHKGESYSDAKARGYVHGAIEAITSTISYGKTSSGVKFGKVIGEPLNNIAGTTGYIDPSLMTKLTMGFAKGFVTKVADNVIDGNDMFDDAVFSGISGFFDAGFNELIDVGYQKIISSPNATLHEAQIEMAQECIGNLRNSINFSTVHPSSGDSEVRLSSKFINKLGEKICEHFVKDTTEVVSGSIS